MKDEAIRQRAKMAMGKDVQAKRYSHGGVVAHTTGKIQPDKTVFQKYGSGYRKVQGK